MRGRNYSVDILRLVAAFGVIVIHLAPSTPGAEVFTRAFLLFAVPFFFLISLNFFIAKVESLPAINFAALRLDRILVPYAMWTVIYPLMQFVKFRLCGKPLALDPIGVILYGGAAVQMYFLPLLLLFQAIALAVLLMFRDAKQRLVAGLVAIGAFIFGFGGSAGGYFSFDDALQKGALYVALAFLMNRLQETALGRRINIGVGGLLVALIVPAAFHGDPGGGWRWVAGPLFGYGVAAIALNWRVCTATPTLRALLTCSYGIYLMHFGFLEFFEFAAGKFGVTLTPYSVVSKILFGALIFLCSVLGVAAARLHWLSAYLLLGESIAQVQPGRIVSNITIPATETA